MKGYPSADAYKCQVASSPFWLTIKTYLVLIFIYILIKFCCFKLTASKKITINLKYFSIRLDQVSLVYKALNVVHLFLEK